MTDSEFEVSTVKAKKELAELRQHAQITAASVMRTVRKGYTSLALFADIFNIVIPEYMNTLISATIMAGETF